jgi:hypothetical protein
VINDAEQLVSPNSFEAVMPAAEIALLLNLIDQAYDRPAWHGPNLRASTRRVKVGEASWRPGPGRKSIAEHVVHAAYWKYAVRRLLRNDPRGSFPLKGSNWFTVAESLSEADWKSSISLLETEHRQLRETVAAFPASRLQDLSPKKRYHYADVIAGVAFHDIYHAGQIQLIRRLIPEASGL